MMPPFSEYRAYLASDEYKASIRALVGEAPAPPRDEWPVDVSHLIAMHREVGAQCVHLAVSHFKQADAMEAAQ
jgi:hypothetical protein